MTRVRITAGPFELGGVLEEGRAPRTCAAFAARLPFADKLVHVRWSGEATWIPLGDLDLGVGFENHTGHPLPGQVLLYPGPYSETELLIPYGGTRFASILGPLAANHFITLDKGTEHLRRIGELTLWEGAQEIAFERA